MRKPKGPPLMDAKVGTPGPPAPVDPRYSEAETDFITGVCDTLADVHRKHGVNQGTLTRWSTDGDWEMKRSVYRDAVEKRVQDQLAEHVAKAKSKAIRRQLDSADQLAGIGMRILATKSDEEVTFGQALDAVRLGAEMERKVLRLEDAASVTVQVGVVPLLAEGQNVALAAMLAQLGGTGGD